MRMKIGRLKKWTKAIPKSGKSIVNFAGEKLMIKELKAGTWVVHVETEAILGFFSKTWDKTDVLDYLASHIEAVKAIRSYELIEDEQVIAKDKETSVGYSCGGISMEHYSDGALVKPSQSMKRYDFTKKGW